MRILITNDDGLHADQLIPLIRWCKKLGQVTTVVPKVEQSGKSHSIELRKAFECKQVELAPDITVYSLDSSPADCVRFALFGLKESFDLVISGVNRGFNVGKDIMYSGTAGAVFEAYSLGIPAIAFSTSPQFYDRAIEPLDQVWAYFQSKALLKRHPCYNVNVVPQAKGIRITRQGGHFYSDDFVAQENHMYLPTGKFVYENSNNLDLDTDCVMSGYISISPMSIDRVDRRVYEALTQQD